ncbi:MAG: hypothetical protein WAM39_28780, partial [Bryobacteraceae bacterium]
LAVVGAYTLLAGSEASFGLRQRSPESDKKIGRRGSPDYSRAFSFFNAGEFAIGLSHGTKRHGACLAPLFQHGYENFSGHHHVQRGEKYSSRH